MSKNVRNQLIEFTSCDPKIKQIYFIETFFDVIWVKLWLEIIAQNKHLKPYLFHG